jgi:chromosome segregation ATPase
VYEQYLKVLEKNPDLQLKRDTSREISSVNELLENWFLVASEDYVSWVNAEEERSLSQAPPQSAPPALAGAFLQSRKKERAKSLTVGRLEQRLLELEQQMRGRDQRVQRLEEQLHARGQKLQRSKHRQQSLTEKLQRSKHRQQSLTEKLQRSKHRQQSLTKKIGRLQQELENVRASRLWKLAKMLRHIKVKLGSLWRSLR